MKISVKDLSARIVILIGLMSAAIYVYCSLRPPPAASTRQADR